MLIDFIGGRIRRVEREVHRVFDFLPSFAFDLLESLASANLFFSSQSASSFTGSRCVFHSSSSFFDR